VGFVFFEVRAKPKSKKKEITRPSPPFSAAKLPFYV
jgi:hypothetical protein